MSKLHPLPAQCCLHAGEPVLPVEHSACSDHKAESDPQDRVQRLHEGCACHPHPGAPDGRSLHPGAPAAQRQSSLGRV